jgi:hypothetical protein
MSDKQPTNWEEIQLQDTIDSLTVIKRLLVAFQKGRQTNNDDLVEFVRALAWDWGSVITTKVVVQLPLDTDIADDLPVSDSALEQAIADIDIQIKKGGDDLYALSKAKHPEVHSNNGANV